MPFKENITLSIRNGNDSDAGYVNVYLNNSNGVICANGWNGLNADVICRHLGYLAARSAAGTVSNVKKLVV